MQTWRTSKGQWAAMSHETVRLFAAQAQAWLRAGGKRSRPERQVEAIQTPTEVTQMNKGRFVSQNASELGRKYGRARPELSTDEKIIGALSEPGAEDVVALTNSETGRTAYVVVPRPYYEK